MTTTELEKVEHVWPAIAPLLSVPHTELEYDRLVQVVDTLVDTVGEDESHPLAPLMEIIGVLIEKYEDQHVPEIAAA